MKLKERLLMAFFGFSMAIALVLLFESSHKANLRSVADVAGAWGSASGAGDAAAARPGNARHGFIKGSSFQQRNLQKMASNR